MMRTYLWSRAAPGCLQTIEHMRFLGPQIVESRVGMEEGETRGRDIRVEMVARVWRPEGECDGYGIGE
jgi:hypothetical protein